MWLSIWGEDPNSNDTIGKYLGIYALLGLSVAFVTVFQAIVSYVTCGIRAANLLHENMLTRIMRAPMSFFDTTPYACFFF